MVLSLLPDAKCVPDGLQSNVYTSSSWPANVLTAFFVSLTAQIFNVLSLLALTTWLLSADQLTWYMDPTYTYTHKHNPQYKNILMYLCMYICTYDTCVCICTVGMHIYVCMHMYVCICMYTGMSFCMYSMCVCIT